MAKPRKKRKRKKPTKKASSGVMMSMRGGFRKAAHRAAGAGPKKAPSKTGKVFNYAITVGLLVLLAYLLLRRFGYI